MNGIIRKHYGMKDKRYCYIRIEEADNGFAVEYEEKVKNPMKKDSVYDDNYTYHQRQHLYSTGGGDTMEQALDKALAHEKRLIMANVGMASEESEEMSEGGS